MEPTDVVTLATDAAAFWRTLLAEGVPGPQALQMTTAFISGILLAEADVQLPPPGPDPWGDVIPGDEWKEEDRD